eukprot:TRINITY_DN756_c0_g2_i1.p1 TRINITY_DN756_c0_g2~~TRINITY_DN756_c0_g2_i1.p1  ORF type:complete len:370 (-),score=67.05 TRINITY_DN756_c0_g2_i1:1003-2112(-)
MSINDISNEILSLFPELKYRRTIAKLVSTSGNCRNRKKFVVKVLVNLLNLVGNNDMFLNLLRKAESCLYLLPKLDEPNYTPKKNCVLGPRLSAYPFLMEDYYKYQNVIKTQIKIMKSSSNIEKILYSVSLASNLSRKEINKLGGNVGHKHLNRAKSIIEDMEEKNNFKIDLDKILKRNTRHVEKIQIDFLNKYVYDHLSKVSPDKKNSCVKRKRTDKNGILHEGTYVPTRTLLRGTKCCIYGEVKEQWSILHPESPFMCQASFWKNLDSIYIKPKNKLDCCDICTSKHIVLRNYNLYKEIYDSGNMMMRDMEKYVYWKEKFDQLTQHELQVENQNDFYRSQMIDLEKDPKSCIIIMDFKKDLGYFYYFV